MRRSICFILLLSCCCATKAQNAEYEAIQHVNKFYAALTRYVQACKRASSDVSITSIEAEIYGFLHGNSKNIDCPADILDFHNPQRDERVALPAHRYVSLLESAVKVDRDFSIVYEIMPIENIVSNVVEVPVKVTYIFRRTKYQYIHRVVFLKGYSSNYIEGITSVVEPFKFWENIDKDCNDTFGGAINFSCCYTISVEVMATSMNNWVIGIGGGFNCTRTPIDVETTSSFNITRKPSWMIDAMIGYCPNRFIAAAIETGLMFVNTKQTSTSLLDGTVTYSQKTIHNPNVFIAPKAIGFIPIGVERDILLTIHCAYDFCLGNRKLWGLRMGVGLQLELY